MKLTDRLQSIHDNLIEHRINVEKRLANIESDLNLHIKRTEILEELYHDVREDVERARSLLNFLSGAAKVAVVLGAIAGVVKVLKDFF